MPDTATVTVTVRGVRLDQLPRLNTALKSYVQRFGSGCEVAVVDDQPKPVEAEPVKQEKPAVVDVKPPKVAEPKPTKAIEKPKAGKPRFGRR